MSLSMSIFRCECGYQTRWMSRGARLGLAGVLLLALGAAGCGATEDAVAFRAASVDEEEEVPRLEVDPGDLFFGLQCQSEEQAQTLRLRNTGTGELRITKLRISGSGFSLEAPPALPAAVAPGGALEVAVKFQPETNKPRRIEGELQVSSNDPERKRVEVELGGMVQQPVLTASPRYIDFGERQTGPGCTVIEDVELRNLERCPGDIKEYRVRGAGSAAVSVRGLMTGTLEANQSQRVQVVWKCERRVRTNAVLTFLDAARRAQATVSLEGEAYRP